MTFLFIASHAASLIVLLLAAAGAGTLAAGSRFSLAFRSALGLALWGHALFLLGILGQLRVVPIVTLICIAIAGGALRGRLIPKAPAGMLGILFGAMFVASFLLALHPPLAFDEPLYHLPFVRALAGSGELRVLSGDMRFPVFPQLQELLCVPLFLLADDAATHLVSLAEILITAALLFDWGRRYETRAGWLAAALFLGSPIVFHLSTIGYVDAALTLFVTGGYYSLDRARAEVGPRSWLVFSGLFLGTACSVKYLGGYFAAAALIASAILFHRRLRDAAVFAASCLAAALPTTLWLTVTTGNPIFPFLPKVFGSTVWSMSLPAASLETRVMRTLQLVWNVTFAREHMNFQPPITPLLGAMIMLAASLRDVRARCVAFIGAVYLIVFSFLPQDSRYLVPLLPLLSIVAAIVAATRWPKAVTWLAVIAIAPGLAYAAYRVVLNGLPPATAAQRSELLATRIPAYRALMRAGDERVYVCGGEELKYYARGEFLGDVTGPYSFERVLGSANNTAAIAENLRRIDVRFFLVAKRRCAPPRPNGGMELVYEDDAAQLWRVQSYGSNPDLR